MLELIIATSMLAMVLTTVGVVLRTGRQAWEAHTADYSRIEAAHATLRHMVRQSRRATSVSSITPSTDNSGRLALNLSDGSVVVWDHDAATSSVNYGVSNATNLLSSDIANVRFTGYRADATTITTTASQVKAIKIDVTVQLPLDTSGSRVVSSWAWLRSW